jgi:acetyltransferase
MLDVILALTKCPIPKGNRVAILTNGGGPAIMATDACVSFGLKMAQISDETKAKLAVLVPAEASLVNPVDMIASATADTYSKCLSILLADENIDMVIVGFTPPVMVKPMDFFDEFPKMVPDCPPIYRFPEAAAHVCAEMYRYNLAKERPEGEVRKFDVDKAAVQKILDERIKAGGGYLEQVDAYKVLQAYGFPVCKAQVVRELDELHDAGEEVGYPLVLKMAGRQIIHKSDIGGVVLDIKDEKELMWALVEMKRKLAEAGLEDKVDKFLIQEMSQPGKEVILGMTLDPKFGPLLLVGTGGKYVEVLGTSAGVLSPTSMPRTWCSPSGATRCSRASGVSRRSASTCSSSACSAWRS